MEDAFQPELIKTEEKEGASTKFNAVVVMFSVIGLIALFIMIAVADRTPSPVNNDPLDILNNNSSDLKLENVAGVQAPQVKQQPVQKNVTNNEEGVGEGLTEGGIKEAVSPTFTPVPTHTPTPTPTPVPTNTSTPSPGNTTTNTPVPTSTGTPTPDITPTQSI